MSKSAVEWLFLMINNPNSGQNFANKLYEQAKAIEKQNTIDAVNYGNEQNYYDATGTIAEKYYEENYGTDTTN